MRLNIMVEHCVGLNEGCVKVDMLVPFLAGRLYRPKKCVKKCTKVTAPFHPFIDPSKLFPSIPINYREQTQQEGLDRAFKCPKRPTMS